jgi:hypothetical protein
MEHFSRFASRHAWTCLFLLHAASELALGAAKLRGFYKFERAAHAKDLQAKAGSRRKRDRVKLVQYTMYHGAARVALGLVGLGMFAFGPGSDLRAVALALAFWHLAAATVPVVNMSRYPDSAALTPTFALHAALGVGFAVLLWHHDTIVDSDFVIGW